MLVFWIFPHFDVCCICLGSSCCTLECCWSGYLWFGCLYNPLFMMYNQETIYWLCILHVTLFSVLIVHSYQRGEHLVRKDLKHALEAVICSIRSRTALSCVILASFFVPMKVSSLTFYCSRETFIVLCLRFCLGL